MTENQKAQICALRKQGVGYMKIAQQMGISQNTIKSFCRRNNLTGIEKPNVPVADGSVCECCGKAMVQMEGRKKKRFCCDACRNKWWNAHLDRVQRKAIYKYKCPNCGKEFEVYGNSHRKYCCHECYVEYRFGGGLDG
nr:MAG TPA: hypothetical protein [Caudoviricetes sp.]